MVAAAAHLVIIPLDVAKTVHTGVATADGHVPHAPRTLPQQIWVLGFAEIRSFGA